MTPVGGRGWVIRIQLLSRWGRRLTRGLYGPLVQGDKGTSRTGPERNAREAKNSVRTFGYPGEPGGHCLLLSRAAGEVRQQRLLEIQSQWLCTIDSVANVANQQARRRLRHG